jgi:hypothetical protein
MRKAFRRRGADASSSRCPTNEPTFIRSFSGILDQPSIRNDVSVAGLGLQTYREFLERDDVAPLAIEGLSCRWRH